MIELAVIALLTGLALYAVTRPPRRGGYRPTVTPAPRGVRPFPGCRSRQHRTIDECYRAGEVKPPKNPGGVGGP